jgi:pyruvate,water dikinase
MAGKPASPGRAKGLAHVVHGDGDAFRVPQGAILIARVLHPHLAPVLTRVAAMVMEEGSLLQHATTLAREFGIPTVVGLAGATSLIKDGELVELDGATGSVILHQDGSLG